MKNRCDRCFAINPPEAATCHQCTSPLVGAARPGFFDLPRQHEDSEHSLLASRETAATAIGPRIHALSRYQLGSLFQLMVPLSVILALISFSPLDGLVCSLPLIFGMATTVNYVIAEARHGRTVSLEARARVFVRFSLLSVLLGATFPLLGFCAGALISGVTGAFVGAALGVVAIIALLRSARTPVTDRPPE